LNRETLEIAGESAADVASWLADVWSSAEVRTGLRGSDDLEKV
jgi:hypothetical protein